MSSIFDRMGSMLDRTVPRYAVCVHYTNGAKKILTLKEDLSYEEAERIRKDYRSDELEKITLEDTETGKTVKTFYTI